MTVDWDSFQKCPVCAAEIGEACAALMAVIVGSTPLKTEAAAPHTGRKLRAGYARTGGDDG